MSTDNIQTSKMLLRSCPYEEELDAFARSHGWRRTSTSDTPSGRHEAEWSTGDNYTTLRYVKDEMAPYCYFYVAGSDPEPVGDAAMQAYEGLQPLVLSDIIPEVDAASAPLQLGQALLRLGIVAPLDLDPDVLERIVGGLSHPDGRVRTMALWATTYSPWAEYRPMIAAIAGSDPDSRLRERARMTLEAFDASGVGDR
jgi:hypothetical protein